MNKELIIRVLEFLKEEPDIKDLTLRQIEERFYQFESFLIQLIEELLQDKEDEHGTLTTWWLYDRAPKQLWETTDTSLTPIDVESAEDFVNYMVKHYGKD